MTHPQVRVERRGRLGHLTLARPGAINALTPAMVRVLSSTLVGWRSDDRVEVVLLDGAGDRGLCAGGDIKFVHAHAGGRPGRVLDFWRHEYQLDALLASYPKPVVTVAHGLTMGGGVGLASHAGHRIVTPSAHLAMPEVLIGLSPDVAALHLLARAPGLLGLHAAMTGAWFGSGDAVAMGFADAVVPGERLAGLGDLLQERDPGEVLAALHTPEAAARPVLLGERSWIDECYGHGDAAEILAALRAHPRAEARQAADVLAGVSPTAAAVALEALRRARTLATMQECLVQDFRISSRFLAHPDLSEGIRARVIDKDRAPRWSVASVSDVTAQQVAAFLAPLGDPTQELAPDRLTT